MCHGCNPYSEDAVELNRSSVFVVRFARYRLHSLEMFCGLMSLPPPIMDNSYGEHQALMASAAMKEAKDSCKHAAKVLRQLASHVMKIWTS